MIVGLTGGIGAGKTLISKIFELFDVPVYRSDDRAKYVMTHHSELKAQLTLLLGQEAYDSKGNLNRAFIATQAFKNPQLLQKMNALVHPLVKEDSLNWSKMQDSPYQLKESAILIESEAYKSVDFIICVTAPIDIRVARVMMRDSVKEEKVIERIQNQLTDEQRLKFAHFQIKNDGEQALFPQVELVHHELLRLSKS